MSDRLYFGTDDDKVHFYTLDGTTFTEQQVYTLTASMNFQRQQKNPGVLSNDNKTIICQVVQGVGKFTLDDDGNVTSDVLLTSDPDPRAVCSNAETSRVLVSESFNTNVRLYSVQTGTRFDSYDPGVTIDQIVWVSSVRAILVDSSSGTHELVDVTGDSIASVAKSSGTEYGRCPQIPAADNKYFSFIGQGGNDAFLLDVSNDTFVEAASADTGANDVNFPAYISKTQFATQSIFTLNNSSFIVSGSFSGSFPSGSWSYIPISDQSRLLAIESSSGTFGDRARLFSFGASSTDAEITLTDEIHMGVSDFKGVSGPTTPEQIFNATYSDASAAPPKQTALVRPLDVQRSIDTDVSWLSQNPKEWTLEVIISVGELQHYRPGNLFFVRADVPGLREGRKVLLKGFSASDIRPTEPVTCVFTAPSETA